MPVFRSGACLEDLRETQTSELSLSHFLAILREFYFPCFRVRACTFSSQVFSALGKLLFPLQFREYLQLYLPEKRLDLEGLF